MSEAYRKLKVRGPRRGTSDGDVSARKRPQSAIQVASLDLAKVSSDQTPEPQPHSSAPEVIRPEIDLNIILRFFWPHVSRSLEDLLHTMLMPALNDLPMLENLAITSLDLHSDTPSFELIELRKTGGRDFRATVKFEHRLKKAIKFSLGPLSFGLGNAVIAGEAILRLDQLLDMIPIVGGIAIQFADMPTLKYELTGLAAVAGMPSIRSLMDGALESVISNYFLGPNRFAYSWSDAVDVRALRHPPPAGLLRTTVGDGFSLARALTTSKARGKDAVASTQIDVRLGGQLRQFTMDGDTQNLANGNVYFMVWDEGHRISLSVWDQVMRMILPGAKEAVEVPSMERRMMGNPRQLLGHAEKALPVSDVLALGGDPQPFKFVGEHMEGLVNLSFQMLSLVPHRFGDVYVLRAEVEQVRLPRSEGEACKVILEIGEGPAAIRLVTNVGYDGGSNSKAVTEEMENIIKSMKARGMRETDIAQILKVGTGAVDAVLRGGSSAELKPNYVQARMDSILYVPIPKALVDNGNTDIKIHVVRPKVALVGGSGLQAIATSSQKLSSLEFGFVAPRKQFIGTAACYEDGVEYKPSDMWGTRRTLESTWLACQARCATTRGCAHFSYWHDRGCHLQEASATKHANRFVKAGAPACYDVHATMSLSLLGTEAASS